MYTPSFVSVLWCATHLKHRARLSSLMAYDPKKARAYRQKNQARIRDYEAKRSKSSARVIQKLRKSRRWRESKGVIWREVRIRENKRFVSDYLSCHPCIDCGERDLDVLEFDHIDPGSKAFSISKSYKYTLKTIKREIEKCAVRCANCHRKRHAEQRRAGQTRVLKPSPALQLLLL
jgi:hypothetical protein